MEHATQTCALAVLEHVPAVLPDEAAVITAHRSLQCIHEQLTGGIEGVPSQTMGEYDAMRLEVRHLSLHFQA